MMSSPLFVRFSITWNQSEIMPTDNVNEISALQPICVNESGNGCSNRRKTYKYGEHLTYGVAEQIRFGYSHRFTSYSFRAWQLASISDR